MISPLLALFIRSLREDSRLKLTYFARAALVLLIAIFLFTTQSDFGWTNAPGLEFFGTVAYVDLGFVILAGVSYFASAVSEEKEEATMGLLRMTNLDPLSILLGKSTSRLAMATLLIAAQFPFTLLAITFGGISLRQIVAAYLAIVAFLFLVSNLALLASVICRRPSGSGVFTGVALFFFLITAPVARLLGILPGVFDLFPASSIWTTSCEAFAQMAQNASPFSVIDKILLPGQSIREVVIFHLASNVGLGLVFFLLAWFGFDRFCGEPKMTAGRRVAGDPPRPRRRGWRPGRAWSHAVAWKEFHFTMGGIRWLLIKFAVYSVPFIMGYLLRLAYGLDSTNWETFFEEGAQFMFLFLVIELAFAAGSIFQNEHREQTLSTLAMMPQGLHRIAYQKIAGVIPSLAAATTGFVVCLLIAMLLDRQRSYSSDGDWFKATIFLISFALLFVHLVAILSLYLKRGALPLGIGVAALIFFAMVIVSVRSPADSDTVFFGFVISFLAATAFLHFATGHRLKFLANES